MDTPGARAEKPLSSPPAGATQPPAAKSGSARPRRFRLISRGALKRLVVLAGIFVIAGIYGYRSMIVMPGESFRGPLPPLTEAQSALAEELKASVHVLADATGGVGRAGNRSTFYPRRFAACAAWIKETLQGYGYERVGETFVERGSPAPNFEVIVPGTGKPDEIIVVGAHYDAFQGTPGADDNASGVAACLYLARVMRTSPGIRTVRFLFFVNEEPPAFWTQDMGSWVYARACRAAGDNIVGMLSLECLGYYSDEPGSQRYPKPLSWFYPDRGDFIAFVSNYSSRSLNKRALKIFRERARFPSEGGSPPGVLPGVGFSDQWSFWQEGYLGIMITNTALFRNPYYHTPLDDVTRVDYERMARVVEGIEALVRTLAED